MSQLLQEGRYDGCRFVKGVYSTKDGKSDRVVLTFQISEGVNRDVYLYCSDGAWPYTEEKLNALGFNGDFGAIQLANGEGVSLGCKHEEFEGKTREKWDVYGGPAPAADDVIRRANARWKSGNGRPPAKPSGAPKAPPPAGGKTAPPPAQKKVPEKGAEPWTKQRAWEAWPSADANAWAGAIRVVMEKTSREEDQFTSDDWYEVACACPPF